MLAVRDGVYIDYSKWFWDTATFEVVDCRGGCTWPHWYHIQYVHRFDLNITSVYNNTHTVTWAPFWSPRNNANYYARNGAPAAYVGSQWNDSFTAACAC